MLEAKGFPYSPFLREAPDQEKRIFNTLMDSISSSGIKNQCVRPTAPIDPDEIKRFLGDPLMQEKYLEKLLAGGDPYRTAVALSPFTCYDLPEDLGKTFKILRAPGNSATPEVFHQSWWLCDASEMLTQQALVNDAVIKVGAGLMVKFDGRLTALCFKSFATDNGTFIANNFYSPDERAQEELRESFRQGTNKHNSARGNWFLMRGVRPEASVAQRLLITVAKKASNMPSSIPTMLEGHNRKDYLKYKKAHY